MRSSAKGHGLQNQVEGVFQEGDRVVVIEDLISTGGSSFKAVEALRAGGANVLGTCAIFTYGFKAADKLFKDNDCPLITLSDYDHLIDQALTTNYVTEADITSLKEWKINPENWNNE